MKKYESLSDDEQGEGRKPSRRPTTQSAPSPGVGFSLSSLSPSNVIKSAKKTKDKATQKANNLAIRAPVPFIDPVKRAKQVNEKTGGEDEELISLMDSHTVQDNDDEFLEGLLEEQTTAQKVAKYGKSAAKKGVTTAIKKGIEHVDPHITGGMISGVMKTVESGANIVKPLVQKEGIKSELRADQEMPLLDDLAQIDDPEQALDDSEGALKAFDTRAKLAAIQTGSNLVQTGASVGLAHAAVPGTATSVINTGLDKGVNAVANKALKKELAKRAKAVQKTNEEGEPSIARRIIGKLIGNKKSGNLLAGRNLQPKHYDQIVRGEDPTKKLKPAAKLEQKIKEKERQLNGSSQPDNDPEQFEDLDDKARDEYDPDA